MTKTCQQCSALFEITASDLQFYERISPVFDGKKYTIPPPKLCPDCRHQQRILFRNERNLYKRYCDLCKASTISIFTETENASFPVYCQECWWSDKWDVFEYGQDVDFSRPFFDQFLELRNKVPRMSLNNMNHENSAYCNLCVGNKNSYLLFASDDNEDCMYGYWINRCSDTYNSSNLADCRMCIELIDSENCYGCIASQDLKNCNNCLFCFDLIGCQDCFGSAGLRNKKYYWCNKQLPKEVYFEKLQSFNMGSYEKYKKMKAEFLKILLTVPRKYAHILQSENVSGDYIIQSNNCHHAFDILDAENCRYVYNLVHQHFNVHDCSYITEMSNSFQMMASVGQEVYFGTLVWYSSQVWYSDLSQQCHHLFGCIGMKHQKHCILNKQYSPEEYEVLCGKICQHMQQTGEWGQFFPEYLSPFAYNQTAAQDYFPMTKEEVLQHGWRWKEPDASAYKPASCKVPDDINDVKDAVVNEVLACENCTKNYRILKSELQFYRDIHFPVPRICSDCRLQELRNLRNPRKLWQRNCDKCQKEIQTTYFPDRPETVYCEQCYLEAVY